MRLNVEPLDGQSLRNAILDSPPVCAQCLRGHTWIDPALSPTVYQSQVKLTYDGQTGSWLPRGTCQFRMIVRLVAGVVRGLDSVAIAGLKDYPRVRAVSAPCFSGNLDLLLTNCLTSSLTRLSSSRLSSEANKFQGELNVEAKKLWLILWLDPLHFAIICYSLVQRETTSKSRTVQGVR